MGMTNTRTALPSPRWSADVIGKPRAYFMRLFLLRQRAYSVITVVTGVVQCELSLN